MENFPKIKVPLNNSTHGISDMDVTAAQKSFLNKCLLQQLHWSHLQKVSDRFLATSQSEDELFRNKMEDILAGKKLRILKYIIICFLK